MESVVARLRASKSEWLEQEDADGRLNGRKWAMERASFDELRRVARLQLFDGDYAEQLDRALGN
jgi:hypothetical protein